MKTATDSFVSESVKDRALGCIYGLLVGDAFGAPFEFLKSHDFYPPAEGEYGSGGMHDVRHGEWTDDGAMALALADSLTHGWDRVDQLERYLEWLYEGKYSGRGVCFDIGNQTARALDTFSLTRDPDVSGEPVHKRSAGNGSIMRLAPVPVWCALRFEDEDEAIDKAYLLGCSSSTTTHGHKLCVQAAGVLSVKLCGLIRGIDTGEHIAELPLHHNVRNALCGKRDKRDRTDAVSGYVLDTLAVACFSFRRNTDFGDTITESVSLGGDTDTVGAVAGQIAGAAYGLSGIHPRWVENLYGKEIADEIITRLIEGGE